MSNDISSFARDFTIDFFGSLIPGSLSLIGIYAGIIYPNWIYYGCEGGRQTPGLCMAFSALYQMPDRSTGFLALLLVAYILGLSYSKSRVDWADSASLYYVVLVLGRKDDLHGPASLPESLSCKISGDTKKFLDGLRHYTPST